MNTTASLTFQGDNLYRTRISRAVDDMMKQEDIFREQLHRNKIIAHLTALLKTVPPETFQAMNEHDLTRRIGVLMSDELVEGLLDRECVRHALMPEPMA